MSTRTTIGAFAALAIGAAVTAGVLSGQAVAQDKTTLRTLWQDVVELREGDPAAATPADRLSILEVGQEVARRERDCRAAIAAWRDDAGTGQAAKDACTAWKQALSYETTRLQALQEATDAYQSEEDALFCQHLQIRCEGGG